MGMYKVLIAEDELLTRAGIVSSVNWAQLNMQIVAQADDGIQALQLYRAHYPEIVITDLNMPRLGGVELIGKICEEERPCKIIVVTCVEDVQVITRLFPYHIFDFLLKSSTWLLQVEMDIVKSAFESFRLSLIFTQNCLFK